MVPDVSIIKCVWDYRQKHVKKPTSTERLSVRERERETHSERAREVKKQRGQ